MLRRISEDAAWRSSATAVTAPTSREGRLAPGDDPKRRTRRVVVPARRARGDGHRVRVPARRRVGRQRCATLGDEDEEVAPSPTAAKLSRSPE